MPCVCAERRAQHGVGPLQEGRDCHRDHPIPTRAFRVRNAAVGPQPGVCAHLGDGLLQLHALLVAAHAQRVEKRKAID
jgi:hypothetical protein